MSAGVGNWVDGLDKISYELETSPHQTANGDEYSTSKIQCKTRAQNALCTLLAAWARKYADGADEGSTHLQSVICKLRQPSAAPAGGYRRNAHLAACISIKAFGKSIWLLMAYKGGTSAEYRATTEEEREIEQMKAEAVKGGILDSELVGTLIKVAVVAVSVAVSVGIAKVAEPIIQTTIAAFPVN
ncbi:uncharacterized protein HaLaN_09522 [Haematococcus lacustris]|uniref:Uncharacterized protein n=1 Tax=Haematococcus lacustris TaxID=44745 RepID=A0A699YUX6_HAELA|nr:uncharacterized protein HaLaN_09522 [Haematococcus lacustris]